MYFEMRFLQLKLFLKMLFAETSRAGDKSVKADCLQKYLPIFIFIYNLLLLLVKILGGYN